MTVWAWLKKWGGALFGALFAVVVVVLGGGWIWRRQQKALGAAKDAQKVAEATRELAALRTAREGIAERLGEHSMEAAYVDERLRASKRSIVDLHENGELIPDEELENVFAELGY